MSSTPSLSMSATVQFSLGATMSCFFVNRSDFAAGASAPPATADTPHTTARATRTLDFMPAPGKDLKVLRLPGLAIRPDRERIRFGVADHLLLRSVPFQRATELVGD